ncbi:NAD(P)/FAD-dependent oxidoreductase [Saliphagus sp. LR7]|uniref:NAD(P)/FAD-dependent oxidoreductase n=1 Tax=Saliphagus sp. LR7 TaxID=2282654 RepID=UPI000DF7D79C|nr:NAD(P)/FAD-dependent oxidoreductase [Saliphagus sp. LR7]
MSNPPQVAVVGGGLAGLVAARHLAAAGGDVTCYERADRVGGRVRTETREGYRFDRGFQVLFTAYPAVQRELDLAALDLRRFSPGATLARPGQRSTLADPLRSPKRFPATLFNTEVTVGDKLRVLALRSRLARTEFDELFSGPDRSIAESLRDRGFSERFLENFVAPFYGGITLDRSLSTSGHVFEYTFKALSAGSIAVPAAGMGAIPEQLAERAREAGCEIEIGREVTAVSSDGEGARITTADGDDVGADAVVVAADPPTARSLTGVRSIPTEARSSVTQYYELGADLDTGRRLVVNLEAEGPNHVAPTTAVAPEYAPGETTMVSATFLGEPEASDEELAERGRRALESWFPARRFDGFDLRSTVRVPFAQFDQPPGFREGLPGPRTPDGPVYLAGDYTRWSSIQGAMESGREAARAVVADR